MDARATAESDRRLGQLQDRTGFGAPGTDEERQHSARATPLSGHLLGVLTGSPNSAMIY